MTHRPLAVRAAFLAVAVVLVTGTGQSMETRSALGQFHATERYSLAQGETHDGDLYVFAGMVNLSGVQHGDFYAWSGNIIINGAIDGDLVLGGSTVDITGNVGDSVRIFAGNVSVSGEIDGDLIVFGGVVSVRDPAHVAGNVVIMGGRITLEGRVDGDILFKGGEVTLRGQVGGNVNTETDTIEISPDARIAGDLTYQSRTELALASDEIVAGQVFFKEKVDEKESQGFNAFRFALRIWWIAGAMIVGLVFLALFRHAAPTVVATIGDETLVGALIGFGTILVVPAAALVMIGLVVPLPLGVVTFVIYLLTIYLAKMPVAIWLGQRLLGLVGQASPSPYLSLILGLVILYPVFEIPFYLGSLAWWVTTCLGIGAIILAVRQRLAGGDWGTPQTAPTTT